MKTTSKPHKDPKAKERTLFVDVADVLDTPSTNEFIVLASKGNRSLVLDH